jgi:hypothetical protein
LVGSETVKVKPRRHGIFPLSLHSFRLNRASVNDVGLKVAKAFCGCM